MVGCKESGGCFNRLYNYAENFRQRGQPAVFVAWSAARSGRKRAASFDGGGKIPSGQCKGEIWMWSGIGLDAR